MMFTIPLRLTVIKELLNLIQSACDRSQALSDREFSSAFGLNGRMDREAVAGCSVNKDRYKQ